jgi:hypothetical protein
MSYCNNGRVHPQDTEISKRENLPPEALLILDNVPSHPHGELISDSVCALFLLTNVTHM